MYKTRLNPPPANGWVPPIELLQGSSVNRQEEGEADVSDGFELVSPDPPQAKLDFN